MHFGSITIHLHKNLVIAEPWTTLTLEVFDGLVQQFPYYFAPSSEFFAFVHFLLLLCYRIYQ